MLKKAYVEITNRCNLACSFCPKTKREPRTMSAQEFGLVLSRLEGYVQYVYLHVMGEPLLHPELTTLFALAKARDMKICITTNGTLLQKRSDELLAAESLHKISVSLHSFEGNDGADEQELSYLTQVWNFAEKAAKKGVIVALASGTTAARTRATAKFSTFCAPAQAITGPRCETAAFFCATTCIWSARANSTGPI